MAARSSSWTHKVSTLHRQVLTGATRSSTSLTMLPASRALPLSLIDAHTTSATATIARPCNRPNLPFDVSGRGRAEDSFTHLMNNLSSYLTTASTPSIPYLAHTLRTHALDAAHWSRYAFRDPSKAYTRNLVCEVPGVFNLMLLVWTPQRTSPVHDHAQSDCLMKVLQGGIRETRFAMPVDGAGASLVETSNSYLGAGRVSYMCDELGLHSVSNPHPTQYAMSLHLYTPPNAALQGCHVYDVHNGHARHVLQGPYDSVRGMASAQQMLKR